MYDDMIYIQLFFSSYGRSIKLALMIMVIICIGKMYNFSKR